MIIRGVNSESLSTNPPKNAPRETNEFIYHVITSLCFAHRTKKKRTNLYFLFFGVNKPKKARMRVLSVLGVSYLMCEGLKAPGGMRIEK